MRAILGTFVVFGSVFGGYLPHGNLAILIQPLEFLIIIGAAFGAYIIATPGSLIREGLLTAVKLAKASHHEKQDYMELSGYLFCIYRQARTQGMMSIEPLLDEGADNELMKAFPRLAKNKNAVTFIHDYLRRVASGVNNEYQLGDLMEAEIRMKIKHAAEPAKAIAEVGQSLPAFGIVAAVLGIIVTMSHIDAGPVEIAHHMSAALVGTFLGILVAYGVVAPIAHALEHNAKSEGEFYSVIRTIMVANLQGYLASIGADLGRTAMPDFVRPDSEELEEYLRGLR
jgi:chemotaxis protein MotA